MKLFQGSRTTLKQGLALATMALAAGASATVSASPNVSLKLLGTYAAGHYDAGAAEIVAHDPITQTLFVINARDSVVDMLDIHNPSNPTKINSLNIATNLPAAGGINSVAVSKGLVAVAVENSNKQANGWIAFYSTRGSYLGSVPAGALPDMVTFTHNGNYVLAANEGEPNANYSVDPAGTVTVVDLRKVRGRSPHSSTLRYARVMTANFPSVVHPDVRITGPQGTTVPQDLEPEYITTSTDSRTAWVTLQENNAIAKIDIATATVLDVIPLGVKNHMLTDNALDASDSDSAIKITTWPVNGLYMPDGIASYHYEDQTYLITANEGDAREYTGYADVSRVKSKALDTTAFPNGADLKLDANMGRLNIVNTEGNLDSDSDYDALYSFGARSISIWDASGNQVFDSGNIMEQVTGARYPANFNASNTNNTFDNRSDDKGPEPEGVTVGKVFGRNYAFVGLERVGGIMIFDVTEPAATRFVDYVNNRDFSQSTVINNLPNPAAGDLGPEGLIFIHPMNSPNHQPLLVVGNEISGTTTIYQVIGK